MELQQILRLRIDKNMVEAIVDALEFGAESRRLRRKLHYEDAVRTVNGQSCGRSNKGVIPHICSQKTK